MLYTGVLDIFRTLFFELVEKYEYYFNRDPDYFINYDDVKAGGDISIVIPVDGNIKLPRYVNYLLEVPIVKRLSEIKQLAYTHMFLLGATHTRLEHSVGVMWKARNLLERIKQLVETSECKTIINLNDDNYVILDLASILHDIGHPAWGHALDGILEPVIDILGEFLEKITPPKKLDIAISVYLILQNEQLKKALDTVAENEIKDNTVRQLLRFILAQIISEEEEIGFEKLMELYEQNKDKYDEIARKIALFTTILGTYSSIGGVNTDRLDWLARDAHHAALGFRLPEDVRNRFKKLVESIVSEKYEVDLYECKYVVIANDEFKQRINELREKVYEHIYEGLPRSFIDSLLTRLAYSVIQLIYNIGLRIAGRSTIARAILGYLLLPDHMLIDYTVRVLLSAKYYNILSIIDDKTMELQYSIHSADLVELLDRLPYITRTLAVVKALPEVYSRSRRVSFRYFKIRMGEVNLTAILLDLFILSEIIERISGGLGGSSKIILDKVYQNIIVASRLNPVKGIGAVRLESELQNIVGGAGVYVLVSHYAFRKIDDRLFGSNRIVKSLSELCEKLKSDELGKEPAVFVVARSNLNESDILRLGEHAFDKLMSFLDQRVLNATKMMFRGKKV